MAQNVTIAGASYSDVPSIVVPKTGSGTASFFDVSDTTAVAADVQNGKYFYTAAGVRTAGTGSGVSAYAYIVVEYPSGAASITCTNTSGSIALSSTMKLFLVSDNASSCVVTISKTNNTVSKTITVASGGSYYVLMMFMHRFVYNGVIQGSNMTTDTRKGDATNGIKPVVTYATGYVDILAGGSGTYNGGGTAYFPETVDLSKYSTVHVKGTARNNSNGVLRCALDVWASIGSTQDANRRVQKQLLSASNITSYTSFDITADVSTYTDSAAYVGFNVQRNNSGYSGIRVVDAWID